MTDPLEGLPDQAHDFLEDELGGGVIIVALNGIVKDYDPPGGIDACQVLLIDPSPARWVAGQVYSNAGAGTDVVTVGAWAVNASGVIFGAQEAASGLTGDEEPAFLSGEGPYQDNEIQFSEVGQFAGEWQPETEYLIGDVIFEEGTAWQSFGGTTGADKPDFSSTQADFQVDEVDAGFNWQSIGPSGIWAPATRFSFRGSPDGQGYGQPAVVASTAQPGDPVWSGQPRQPLGSSGPTEPAWDDATEGDSSVYVDHEILWAEGGFGASLAVITGIAAPTAPMRLSIGRVSDGSSFSTSLTLEDQFYVPDDYPYYASQEGNALDALESNIELTQLQLVDLVHVGDRWRVYNE